MRENIGANYPVTPDNYLTDGEYAQALFEMQFPVGHTPKTIVNG